MVSQMWRFGNILRRLRYSRQNVTASSPFLTYVCSADFGAEHLFRNLPPFAPPSRVAAPGMGLVLQPAREFLLQFRVAGRGFDEREGRRTTQE